MSFTAIKPASGFTPLSSSAPSQPQQSLSDRIMGGVAAFGKAIAPSAVDQFGSTIARFSNALDPNLSIQQKLQRAQYLPDVSLKQAIGSGLELGSLVSGIAAPAAATLPRAALQYGTIAGAGTAGSDLGTGASTGQTVKDTALSAGLGGATGAAFNLLGRALTKSAPAALSFTSGVPVDAIKQAGENPQIAKQGLDTTVEKVRNQAVGSLQGLYRDLGGEFKAGLEALPEEASPKMAGISTKLMTQAQDIANQFNVSTKAGIDGMAANFDKSAIVKGGEQGAVQKTLDTITKWNDFTPRGIQDLEARVGALRNFDSDGITRSSAIVGKIYDSINGVIKDTYPQLAALRSEFHTNKVVLDEISNVLSASKDSPVSIQSSITRLSNIFKTDREQYVNIIKQLGDRSGVDYLSLLAGTEFQKILPGFIRGVGGGSAVGVGASVLNPYLLLLAPLFSPRVAGVISRNAPAVANASKPIIRTAATQAIQKFAPALGRLLGGSPSPQKSTQSSQQSTTDFGHANPDGTMTLKGPFTGKDVTLDPAMGALSLERVGVKTLAKIASRIHPDDVALMRDITDYAAKSYKPTAEAATKLELDARRIWEHYFSDFHPAKTIRGIANDFGRVLDHVKQ